MVQITGEIFQVGGGPLTAPEDAAVYLINIGGHAALVDSGCGFATERLLHNIRKSKVDPSHMELLLLTHCHFDHTGGAKALKDLIDSLQIVAHELDAPFLERGDNEVTAAGWYDATIAPFHVDRKLTGPREEILLGGRVIEALHAPGHSPGSVVYLLESEGQRVLFAHDVHGPLHPSFLSNRGDYMNSLRMLLDLGADILCEGHYGVFKGKEVARFISQFLDS